MKKFLLVLMVFAVCLVMHLPNKKEEKVEVEEATFQTYEMLDDVIEVELIKEKNVLGVYLNEELDLKQTDSQNKKTEC